MKVYLRVKGAGHATLGLCCVRTAVRTRSTILVRTYLRTALIQRRKPGSYTLPFVVLYQALCGGGYPGLKRTSRKARNASHPPLHKTEEEFTWDKKLTMPVARLALLGVSERHTHGAVWQKIHALSQNTLRLLRPETTEEGQHCTHSGSRSWGTAPEQQKAKTSAKGERGCHRMCGEQ